CVGFLEGVFLREEDWFRQDEETVSELLLPIMVGSGLFEDQPEFAEIAQDEEMVQDMLDHIPDVLTQLYLLFQAPEEKGRPALLDPRHCVREAPALAGVFLSPPPPSAAAPAVSAPPADSRWRAVPACRCAGPAAWGNH